MTGPAPTAAAERQRRHRERRRAGIFVVPVQVTCEMVETLIKQGDLDEANSSDLDCVGKAITAAALRPHRVAGGRPSMETIDPSGVENGETR